MQGGPLMHVIAGKAVVFGEAMQPDFADYQRAMLDNATALADGLQELGLRLVAGGTDNHMVLVDLTATGITGREAEEALGAVGIVVNRNAIPFDPRSPRITSGIRLGAPAVSSRGFGTAEMKQVAALIVKVLNNINDSSVQVQVAAEVGELARRFPLPGAPAA
jgi:glycine hydroxymethyltransferase